MCAKKRLVVLTGAGISAESGLKTFRDHGGLWEGFKVEDVATPEAWQRDPEMVQRFYNERRKAVLEAKPNDAHFVLQKLEDKFDVAIITQNIDDLHERAGSSNVVHLHGIITRSQSSKKSSLTYPLDGWEITEGSVCELGSPLRPHVVWFGEAVPMMEKAVKISSQADIFMVIGTSLIVYPAASLVDYVPDSTPKYMIDKNIPQLRYTKDWTVIQSLAATGVPIIVGQLLNEQS